MVTINPHKRGRQGLCLNHLSHTFYTLVLSHKLTQGPGKLMHLCFGLSRCTQGGKDQNKTEQMLGRMCLEISHEKVEMHAHFTKNDGS